MERILFYIRSIRKAGRQIMLAVIIWECFLICKNMKICWYLMKQRRLQSTILLCRHLVHCTYHRQPNCRKIQIPQCIIFADLKWQKICYVMRSSRIHILSSHRAVISIKPVSYTHLDVYKRQYTCFICKPAKECITCHSWRCNIWGGSWISDNFWCINGIRIAIKCNSVLLLSLIHI